MNVDVDSVTHNALTSLEVKWALVLHLSIDKMGNEAK